MAVGIVKFYREQQGVGAISSEALPPGRDARVHFSMIEGSGYLSLTVGEVVDFEFEHVTQDSFDYRATVVRRRPPVEGTSTSVAGRRPPAGHTQYPNV